MPASACHLRTVAEFEAAIGVHDAMNMALFVGVVDRRAMAAIVRLPLLA